MLSLLNQTNKSKGRIIPVVYYYAFCMQYCVLRRAAAVLLKVQICDSGRSHLMFSVPRLGKSRIPWRRVRCTPGDCSPCRIPGSLQNLLCHSPTSKTCSLHRAETLNQSGGDFLLVAQKPLCPRCYFHAAGEARFCSLQIALCTSPPSVPSPPPPLLALPLSRRC